MDSAPKKKTTSLSDDEAARKIQSTFNAHMSGKYGVNLYHGTSTEHAEELVAGKPLMPRGDENPLETGNWRVVTKWQRSLYINTCFYS